ncbi:type II toxin-antitoxin system RelE/ParE family toxin [Alkalibaculum sp. M08DMB]|uniref:Type II toxin-antitoxin system RelE/ParE family toxin n=1 Tax=Alkalibaculum sporogenes TaxID=2655001 RepID=A0A6A7KCG1_9FIRM|nr:type II toxin-antitoxin system RelE/ParE family toxin [Alkalibaculum sporogenes]MPW27220.1 type II toxin-antitoxin system RelE/ParE family toxin [Alkalibaculum sporogenes]
MYKIQYSPRAKEDLLKIKQYIVNEFDKEIAAIKVKNIITKIKNLGEYPLMGRPLSNMIDVSTEYMYLVIDKNYVFYRNEDKCVNIIRVLDTRHDYMRALFHIREVEE